MKAEASVIAALTAGIAIWAAPLAEVEFARGGYPKGGSHWGRRPNVILRSDGPAFIDPTYSAGDPGFWDCYAYDAAERRWVRTCR